MHRVRISAFSLVELLIVVAIIAIISAIALANYREAHTRSQIARARSDMRAIIGGIAAYCTDNSGLPADGDDVSPLNPDLFDTRIGLTPITTPIAYLHSMHLAPTPFEAELNPPEKRHRIAYEWSTTRFLTPGSPQTGGGGAGYQPTGSMKFWIAWGGPDGRFDYPSLRRVSDGDAPGNGFTIPAIAEARARDYDPTNGTESHGDIVTWGP